MISSEERRKAIELVREANAQGARKHKACALLGISLRTLERWEHNCLVDRRQGAQRHVGNKLTEEEQAMIVRVMNSPNYADLPPCQIVPRLVDQGIYMASESTFYRILRKQKQLAHRGLTQRRQHKRPRPFEAKGPNQLWSWDITYLPSQVKGLYFYLYMILDVFSRKIVGWSIHEEQNSELAAALIKQTCLDEHVKPEQLVLHSDNGSPMKGATMLAMLQNLGVVPSFSRPSVSDDNPYSEALFKTLKYHPTFPATGKFATTRDARRWTLQFVSWYNNVHQHSALKFVTPSQRHERHDQVIMKNREDVYRAAKKAHPQRWSGQFRNWTLPETVMLNPNRKKRAVPRTENNEYKLIA